MISSLFFGDKSKSIFGEYLLKVFSFLLKSRILFVLLFTVFILSDFKFLFFIFILFINWPSFFIELLFYSKLYISVLYAYFCF